MQKDLDDQPGFKNPDENNGRKADLGVRRVQLDSDACPPHEIEASLRDLSRINRWFGGEATTRDLIERAAAALALSRLWFDSNRALAVVSPAMRATPISRQSVFSLRFMSGISYIASPIPSLVSLEVVEAFRPAPRQRSRVPVMGIKAVVDMAVETVRTVKPGPRSKKHSAHKPIRPIIAVRSAVVRGIVEVSVRTDRSHSDIDAHRNLGRHRCCAP